MRTHYSQSLASRTEVINVAQTNKRIGINVGAAEIATYLNRMQLPSKVCMAEWMNG
jgi:hypothetical protein